MHANDNATDDGLVVTLRVRDLRALVRESVREALEAKPTETEGAMLTPAQTAAMLGVTRHHVRNLLARGALPGVRVGHAWRVRRADVEALMRGGRDAA